MVTGIAQIIVGLPRITIHLTETVEAKALLGDIQRIIRERQTLEGGFLLLAALLTGGCSFHLNQWALLGWT